MSTQRMFCGELEKNQHFLDGKKNYYFICSYGMGKFFIFSQKMYVVDIHSNGNNQAIRMSTTSIFVKK